MPDDDTIQEIDYSDTAPPKTDPLADTGIEDIKYRSKRHYFVPTERGEKVTAAATKAKEISAAGYAKAKEVTTTKLIPGTKSAISAVGSGTVTAARALKDYQAKQKLKRETLDAQARGYGHYAPRRARRTRDRIAYVDGQPVIVRGGQAPAPLQVPGSGAPDITSGIAGRMAPQITDLGSSGAPSILGGLGGKSGILEGLQARGGSSGLFSTNKGSSGLFSTGKGSGLFSMPKGGLFSSINKRRR